MKNRLPRKRKKEVKRIVGIAYASKSARSAIISAQSAMQIAMISAQPIFSENRRELITQKAIKIVDVTKNTAESLTSIWSEFPKSWRDFIK